MNDIAVLVDRASKLTRVPAPMITGQRRLFYLCRIRWAVMMAARRRGYPLEHIAAELGRKDHTTVIHGLARAEHLRDRDPAFADLVGGIAS